MAVTGVARLATSPSGACAALIGRWTRELCSEPTTMMLLFLAMWLGSNAYRAFSGPAHLQPGYMVPRAHSPAPNATGADVSGFALDADPSVLSTTFRVIQRGGYPVDGQYAESVTPNLRTCQQICASEPRCFMMSFNPSGYTTGGDVGRPYACARYDYSATEARMARGSHTTWRCVRERGKVPAVRRPPASERNKAVAVVYAGVHPHIAFVQRELLESQALLLNTLIREYEQVDVFFCVEPRHIPDVQDFRFTIEAGFERELVTTAAFGREGVKGMFGRLRGCWVDVAKYADTHNASYQWIVRTRPDIFFLGPLRPTLQLASQNAIHARGRRFGPRWDKIRGEEVSYWDYYDVCGEWPSFSSVMRARCCYCRCRALQLLPLPLWVMNQCVPPLQSSVGVQAEPSERNMRANGSMNRTTQTQVATV